MHRKKQEPFRVTLSRRKSLLNTKLAYPGISLSLSPAEGHFVGETRLAMIHVCTSNENAYQDRRVSYLRDFRRLKIGSGTHEKEQRYAQDPRIHL